VHAHPHRWEALYRFQFADDAQPKAHGQGGVVSTQHQGVTERLDLFAPVIGHQAPDPLVELDRHVGGVLVAALGGQCGEADQVGEEEGVMSLGHRIPNGI
jgi:hypothetical protein